MIEHSDECKTVSAFRDGTDTSFLCHANCPVGQLRNEIAAAIAAATAAERERYAKVIESMPVVADIDVQRLLSRAAAAIRRG